MGSFSLWHWLIVAIVALLLFGGRGKISQLMGDAAQGIRAFQRGLKDGADEERGTTRSEAAGALPRTEAEQEALRRAAAEQPAEPR